VQAAATNTASFCCANLNAQCTTTVGSAGAMAGLFGAGMAVGAVAFVAWAVTSLDDDKSTRPAKRRKDDSAAAAAAAVAFSPAQAPSSYTEYLCQEILKQAKVNRDHANLQSDMMLASASHLKDIREHVMAHSLKEPTEVFVIPQTAATATAAAAAAAAVSLPSPPLLTVAEKADAKVDGISPPPDARLSLPFRRFKTLFRIDSPRPDGNLICHLEDICAVSLETYVSGDVSIGVLFHHDTTRKAEWTPILAKTSAVSLGFSIMEQFRTAMDKHGIGYVHMLRSCSFDEITRKINPEGCGAHHSTCPGHTQQLYCSNHLKRVYTEKDPNNPQLTNVNYVFCRGVTNTHTGKGPPVTAHLNDVHATLDKAQKQFALKDHWPSCVGCGISAQLSPCVRIFLDREGNRMALCENCVLDTTLYTIAKSGLHAGNTIPPPPPPPSAATTAIATVEQPPPQSS